MESFWMRLDLILLKNPSNGHFTNVYKYYNAKVSYSEFCEVFKNTSFSRIPLMAASVYKAFMKYFKYLTEDNVKILLSKALIYSLEIAPEFFTFPSKKKRTISTPIITTALLRATINIYTTTRMSSTSVLYN